MMSSISRCIRVRINSFLRFKLAWCIDSTGAEVEGLAFLFSRPKLVGPKITNGLF